MLISFLLWSYWNPFLIEPTTSQQTTQFDDSLKTTMIIKRFTHLKIQDTVSLVVQWLKHIVRVLTDIGWKILQQTKQTVLQSSYRQRLTLSPNVNEKDCFWKGTSFHFSIILHSYCCTTPIYESSQARFQKTAKIQYKRSILCLPRN